MAQKEVKEKEAEKKDDIKIAKLKKPETRKPDTKNKNRKAKNQTNSAAVKGKGKQKSNAYSVISNPTVKSQVPPQYPRRAVKLGWQGIVIVEAIVDLSGKPKATKVHKSSGFEVLDDAAITAVSKWQFDIENSVKNTRFALVRVPVNFVINKS